MRVLVLKHSDTTRLGSLGTFLEKSGADVELLHLHRGERLPATFDFDALVVMGGRMHAFDDADCPWLPLEAEWIARVVEADKPMLGICLGAQLLARALGAKVIRKGAPEEGYIDVALTDPGRSDPLFAGLPATFPSVANHGDLLEVPARASLLASSTGCANQAIRRRNAWGLQFHLETDRDVLDGWLPWKPHWSQFRREFETRGEELLTIAETIYQNFAAAW